MRRIGKFFIDSLLLVMFLSLLILPISSIGLTTFSTPNKQVLGQNTVAPRYTSSSSDMRQKDFDASTVFERGLEVTSGVSTSINFKITDIKQTSQATQSTQGDKQ